MYNKSLFEGLDKYFDDKSAKKNLTEEVDNQVSKVKIEAKYEVYNRYGDNPTKTVQISGVNLKDAVVKFLDRLRIFQYIGCDYDMSLEQIISNLETSNGDGCEYIFYIKDLTDGKIVFEGSFNDEDIEDWDDLDEALNAEDARNIEAATEKAQAALDDANAACDKILREDADDEYPEEEKILDSAELSYEKDGKKVREKFNTIIEAKERREELGLTKENSIITAVYESGELELVESILKDAACTSPDCEEEAKNEGLADRLRAAVAGKPLPKDLVVKDDEPDLHKTLGKLSDRLKKRMQAESVEDTDKVEEAVNTLIPEKYRKYYKSISKKQACNIFGVEPEDLDDENIEGQIIGYAIAKDKYFDTLASDGEEFMYIVKFNDSDTPTLAYSAGGRTFEPSYYSGAIIDESIKPEIKKLGAKK